MPATALKPRSSTEIVDAAFQLFRLHAGTLVMCSAVAYIPTLLVRLLVVGDPTRFATDPSRMGEFVTASAWSTLASAITYGLLTALLTVCVSQAYLGEPLDVGAAVRRTLPRVPALLGATVLVYLMLGLGFLLFLLPALWVAARNFAVTQAMLLENLGVFAGLRRSAELSRGRKRHILNTIGLVVLIYFVLYFGLILLAMAVGGFIVQTFVAALLTIVLYPVIVATTVLLYYDARIQSEGLDIELMADALDATPRPATT